MLKSTKSKSLRDKENSARATLANDNKSQSTEVSMQPSSRKKPTNSQPFKECIFCQKFNHYRSFGPLLNKALYSKYSSSQNYYFSKDINDILAGVSTPNTIRFRDNEALDTIEEYFKRFYKVNEYSFKISALTEYYKYHKDVARLFMLPVSMTMNRYHDKKRRIEYVKIKKMLNLETSASDSQQSADSQQSSKDSKKKKNKDEKLPPGLERILADLDFSLAREGKNNNDARVGSGNEARGGYNNNNSHKFISVATAAQSHNNSNVIGGTAGKGEKPGGQLLQSQAPQKRPASGKNYNNNKSLAEILNDISQVSNNRSAFLKNQGKTGNAAVGFSQNSRQYLDIQEQQVVSTEISLTHMNSFLKQQQMEDVNDLSAIVTGGGNGAMQLHQQMQTQKQLQILSGSYTNVFVKPQKLQGKVTSQQVQRVQEMDLLPAAEQLQQMAQRQPQYQQARKESFSRKRTGDSIYSPSKATSKQNSIHMLASASSTANNNLANKLMPKCFEVKKQQVQTSQQNQRQAPERERFISERQRIEPHHYPGMAFSTDRDRVFSERVGNNMGVGSYGSGGSTLAICNGKLNSGEGVKDINTERIQIQFDGGSGSGGCGKFNNNNGGSNNNNGFVNMNKLQPSKSNSQLSSIDQLLSTIKNQLSNEHRKREKAEQQQCGGVVVVGGGCGGNNGEGSGGGGTLLQRQNSAHRIRLVKQKVKNLNLNLQGGNCLITSRPQMNQPQQQQPHSQREHAQIPTQRTTTSVKANTARGATQSNFFNNKRSVAQQASSTACSTNSKIEVSGHNRNYKSLAQSGPHSVSLNSRSTSNPKINFAVKGGFSKGIIIPSSTSHNLLLINSNTNTNANNDSCSNRARSQENIIQGKIAPIVYQQQILLNAQLKKQQLQQQGNHEDQLIISPQQYTKKKTQDLSSNNNSHNLSGNTNSHVFLQHSNNNNNLVKLTEQIRSLIEINPLTSQRSSVNSIANLRPNIESGSNCRQPQPQLQPATATTTANNTPQTTSRKIVQSVSRKNSSNIVNIFLEKDASTKIQVQTNNFVQPIINIKSQNGSACNSRGPSPYRISVENQDVRHAQQQQASNQHGGGASSSKVISTANSSGNINCNGNNNFGVSGNKLKQYK